MAKYIIELRNVLERTDINLNSYMQNYPIYTFKKLFQSQSDFGKNYKGEQITNFRDYLNNLIYTHFYFREIGLETEHRFAFCLQRKMNEIMNYYNQMFASADTEFNPLWNVEMHETYTHSVTDTGNGTINSTGKTTENGTSKRTEDLEQNIDNDTTNNSTRTPNLLNETVNAKMDTAQQPITPDDLKTLNYFSEGDYKKDSTTGTETNNLTSSENGKITNDNEINSVNENEVNSTNQASSTNSNNRTETYTRLQEGSSAGLPYSDAIKQWRNIMINIPMMICDELDELFMQID